MSIIRVILFLLIQWFTLVSIFSFFIKGGRSLPQRALGNHFYRFRLHASLYWAPSSKPSIYPSVQQLMGNSSCAEYLIRFDKYRGGFLCYFNFNFKFVRYLLNCQRHFAPNPCLRLTLGWWLMADKQTLGIARGPPNWWRSHICQISWLD